MRTPAALAATLLAACSPSASGAADGREDVAKTTGRQQPSYVAYTGAAPEVSVPSTVRAGEDLQVQIRTYGGGCNEKGGDEVRVDGLTALVLPWDFDRSTPETPCQDMLRTFDHAATVRFGQPGTATVRVRGRRLPGDEPVEVVRTVTVTP